ncbi:MAG: hypothetical protein K0R57_2840 [Paenibacillaceae bacterium]|jgi:hypothetical protein|nr:hypothetical protein [Paenibacillaceae bacterium]
MRHFSHVRYVAIDRETILESDEKMVQALQSFQTMYEIRVIVIAEGLPESSPFLRQLVQTDILNIVAAEEIKTMQEEIRECFSEQGMQRFIPAASVELQEEKPQPVPSDEEKQYHFNCTNVTIAIAGFDRRVGVTTTAFNLVCWINAHGGTACYLEANPSHHLAHIIHLFQAEKTGNAYVMENCDFYMTKEIKREYNFIVVDCGALGDKNLQEAFVNVNIRVLCGSAMPYELPVFYRAIERCKDLSVWALGLFVPADMQLYLKNSIQHNIQFSEVSHNLFDWKANDRVCKNSLKDYIVKHK